MKDKSLEKIKNRLIVYGLVVGIGILASIYSEEKDKIEGNVVEGEEKVKNISSICEELKEGKQLIIGKELYRDIYWGDMIEVTDERVSSMDYEVDVDMLVKEFPYIAVKLEEPSIFCYIRYDDDKQKYITEVQKRTVKEDQSEEIEIVPEEDLIVESDDLFLNFARLEEKLKKKKELQQESEHQLKMMLK